MSDLIAYNLTLFDAALKILQLVVTPLVTVPVTRWLAKLLPPAHLPPVLPPAGPRKRRRGRCR